MKYPTKEEILNEKPKFLDGTVLITKMWKTISMKEWKDNENWVKMEKLGLLIEALSALHGKKSPGIVLDSEYSFEPKDKIIHLDMNMSYLVII